MALYTRRKSPARISGAWPSMQVSILEPRKIVWEGRAKEVRLPAEDGEVCVLDFHQPFLIRLRKGVVRSDKVRTAIKDGIAFLRSNKLILFVEV